MFEYISHAEDYGIEVKGQASVLVEPDSFSLSIAIIEKGRFTDKIRAIVDHKSNQVIDIAKGLGVKSRFINSARVSLRVLKEAPKINVQGLSVEKKLANKHQSELYIKNNTAQLAHGKPQYFELSRHITVNFSQINDYDQFLNKVIKIGVSQISPLSMSIADTDKYYQQALMLAIDKAKEKASKIRALLARPNISKAELSNIKLELANLKLYTARMEAKNDSMAQVNQALVTENAEVKQTLVVKEQEYTIQPMKKKTNKMVSKWV